MSEATNEGAMLESGVSAGADGAWKAAHRCWQCGCRDPQQQRTRCAMRDDTSNRTNKDNSCERSEPRVVLVVGRARSHAEGGL